MQRDFGPALRWLRQRRHKKQHEVAEAAGITRPMLSAYERSKVKPTLDTLEGILRALGCDLTQLAGALKVVGEEMPPALGEKVDRAPEPTPSSGVLAREVEAFESLKLSLLKWLDAARERMLDVDTLRGDRS